MEKSELRSISTMEELEASIRVNSLMASAKELQLRGDVASGRSRLLGEGFRAVASSVGFKSILPLLLRFAFKRVLKRF